MDEILRLLPVLAVAMLMNIGAGVYNNIGKNQEMFDLGKLIFGCLKALIVGFMFVGAAYCFDATDLSSIGATPELIMNSAIVLYVGKAIKNLTQILGVSINK